MHNIVGEIKYTLEGKEISLADRSKVFEVLIAEAVAARMDLPTSPVEDVRQYFMTHHKVDVITKLSKVNELQVIDVDRTTELTYKTWLLRYRLVFEMCSSTCGRLLNHAVEANVLSMDPEHRRVITENKDVFLNHYTIKESKELGND